MSNKATGTVKWFNETKGFGFIQQRFRTRVVKAKKGKGSFNRKAKHRGKEPYSKFSPMWILNRAFSYLKVMDIRCLSVRFWVSK